MEGNLPFLLCFTLYLRAIFQVQAPGAYIWRGDLTEGFLRYRFGGLIFGGAYFRNFTVISIRKQNGSVSKQGQPGRLKFPWLVYYKPTAVIGLLSSFSVCCFYLQLGFIFDAWPDTANLNNNTFWYFRTRSMIILKQKRSKKWRKLLPRKNSGSLKNGMHRASWLIIKILQY